MAARHFVSYTDISEEAGALALADSRVRQLIGGVLQRWFIGLDECTDALPRELVAAQNFLAQQVAMQSASERQVAPSPPTPYTVDSKALLLHVDGQAETVTAEGARMAQILLDADGEWVSMRDHEFTKPSEVKGKLPEAVQDLIETAKGKGYRLKRR